MTVTIHSSFLPHTDAEAALGFYRDLLGFELRLDVGYDGKRWLTVGPPGQPDTAIVLTPLGVNPGVTEEESAMIEEMVAKGTYASVLLASDDLDATFDTLVAGDVEIIQEPMDQPYGLRDCAVRDPSGNMVRIQQKPA
ncbi:VOC family protein [Gordonia amarae]|uniref:VOC domain-containing protein n=2 Tax=Gordonia amarae TaxID=36821 RepID=G7GPH6_9ACTN|nr:VOC family protein [Gordonia amarae]MCS3879019.1 putative glyoxalase superfamily protein PhnB [Gordonia amarae]QHN17562.1 VOC family protein [Gordonia amarae]QHN22088.1 VOC family protein [Gordonia amarae]QHN30969.1 VOC family protein [Gordonia amarae]QHN39715.1 VOC family protein [Gordonia amarae]